MLADVRRLRSAGHPLPRERIDAVKIQEDIDSGAPTNPDGTLNLVNYAAWQSEEMGRAD